MVGLTFGLAVVTTASTFSNSYIMFTVLRFATGLLSPGFFFVIFVWGKTNLTSLLIALQGQHNRGAIRFQLQSSL